MPRKSKAAREYRFQIDAYSPETIPLARLSQYLSDLARMMGESESVHLARIEPGSTVPIIAVEWEAEPKIQERLRAVKFSEGPPEAQRAYREINRKLVEDNANGVLIGPSRSKLIKFPGRDGANQPEYGPIRQYGTFQGIPIRIGGELGDVPIHLEDGEHTHIVSAPRRIAKQIGMHLFTSVVRVEGIGRWLRSRLGEWELRGFDVQNFEVLKEGDIQKSISLLRAIPSEWKKNGDPLGELMALRTGERPQ
jgi:hypothetical protein